MISLTAIAGMCFCYLVHGCFFGEDGIFFTATLEKSILTLYSLRYTEQFKDTPGQPESIPTQK